MNILRNSRWLILFGAAGCVVTMTACSGSSDSAFSGIPAGAERGPCREGGACDPGLECRSDLCVEATTSTGGSTSNSGGSTSNSGGSTTGGTSSSGGNASASGGMSSGGTSTAGTGGGTNGDSSTVECIGAHPNVEGTTRFCDTGSCYCSDPFDTCFDSTVASSCCNVAPLCGDLQSDRGVTCDSTHPIIGPPRTCESGYCLCSGQTSSGQNVDACYPEAVARACCPLSIDITCVP